ncbi:SufE family protein [Hyphobacterium sp. CCMP332]|nr:SufE family protein [Hyphobacterium sp. CCMP332]
MKSSEDIQNEIIEEFAFLGDDREAMINYIMELGEKLEPLQDLEKVEDNIIKGCQSKVWLISELKDGKVQFTADSNTAITKGLISLLIRVLNNRSPKEIIDANLFFMEKIGMSNMIGSQRSNGFVSMIKKMKIFALAYQGQLQND